MRRFASAVVLLAALGCRSSSHYTGVGDVVAVDADAARVTISHDDIPGLMGAMTMPFPVASRDVLAGLGPGVRVRFDLEQRGDTLVLTRFVAIGAAGGPRPGVHDHTPHHGGVVVMVGMRHLEAAATPDGTLRAWVTDVWRRPVSLDGASGTATVQLPDGRHEVPLAVHGEALEGRGPPLAGAEVSAHVVVMQAGAPLDSNFVLPLTATVVGAANVPREACTPPERPGPRCVLEFAEPVTSVATIRAAALVAVVNGWVTTWRLPDARFDLGFAAPPPIVAPESEAPHSEAANAVVASPDGREAAVALENRVLVYDVQRGALARTLASFRGVVRSVAWAPDGESLVVSVFYDRNAHQVRADDGREVRTLPAAREAAGVAVAVDGRVAVGDERGELLLFAADGSAVPALVGVSERSIDVVAFAGNRLVASGYDGVVRVWGADLSLVAEDRVGSPVIRLAVAPDGNRVASGGLDATIRVHDVQSGRRVATLEWHTAAIVGLAWDASALVSGDARGRVAFWSSASHSLTLP